MTTFDQGNDTRSRILAAARQLFAERGYAGTSLADIASQVGLTKTAVAYHFHPKDKLAAELIAPAADDLIRLLGGDFGTGTRVFVEPLADFMVRHRAVIGLLMDDIGGADSAPPGSPGETIRAFRDEIHAKLAGPAPSDEDRIRAWAVMGALQLAVVKTMALPQETVWRMLVALALAIHDSATPSETLALPPESGRARDSAIREAGRAQDSAIREKGRAQDSAAPREPRRAQDPAVFRETGRER
ncbi:TetR/AcrR family transcriptional regulator [Sphaerisporangium corydalis]|uniref:TetR family transcriptional regulator n=1 Tax=Sphaerisporangium corydalis TaxID=1441875 RepID=A0ABV9E904_9ACTN|nr:TetR/AcrR family transcriptional regulator [Sphaerisporangium corydalis]